MQFIETARNSHNPFNAEFFPAKQWGGDFWINLIDQMDMPLLVYRPEGRLVFSNMSAAKLLGLEGKEGEYLPEHLYPLIKAAGKLEIYDHGRQVQLVGADMEPHCFLLKSLPMDTGPNLVLAHGNLKDISQVSGANKSPQGFGESMALAGEVSQKVQGPLAGIELYASILGEELDQTGVSDLSAILEEIRYSVREVNEYLTSFESMTKPLKLDLLPWNLALAVDEALETLASLFKSRGIGVLVEQKEMIVVMDKALMVQTFLNILLNAIEAMPRGGRLIVRQELNRMGEAEVIITDSGEGVAFNDVQKIFNPFYTTKKQPLGLGLPVSRRIVEAHEGRIIFGQDEIMGARVKVVLPYIQGDPGAITLN
ncbi:MAG: hypothetical protein LBE38_10765 [Deltaproteobacteria bacterium]|jgi:nitrogen fixation/metabolism regulation signal transduction histidine kinase|nr:hypothetical protein [Deltaproteobacteria bacterium]